jgi:hypothetical protein
MNDEGTNDEGMMKLEQEKRTIQQALPLFSGILDFVTPLCFVIRRFTD